MTEVRGERLLRTSRPTSWWNRCMIRLERRLFRSGWPARLGRMPLVPRVTCHRIVARDGAASRRSLRIAYASDFHAGPTTHPSLLAAACAALREAEPDLLLLGGDFVESDPAAIDALAPLLGEIPAPFGRLAVLGNHDWWSSPQRVVDALTAAGVHVLINRNIRLPAPFEDVWVCGLDDHTDGTPDADAAMDGADGMRLVLMHSPSSLLDIDERRFDLALCGHTHGGQIALPGGRPIVVAQGALSRRYSRGRYDLENGGTLLVSVGIGCSLLPFRAFCHPEIVICELDVG